MAGLCDAGSARALAWIGLVVLTSCAAPDPSRLRGDDGRQPAGGSSGGVDAGTGDGGGVAGSSGSGGTSGEAGSGGSGGTGGGEPPPECEPNPGDEVCPERCPELCNGEDDDCDLRIDENVDATCVADHATGACADGVCRVLSCEGGYRDCDTEFDNGCEAGDSDPNHCGTCGHECTFVNRNATCFEGSCVPTDCAEGWDDCDSNTSDCETALDSLNNCGGCGMTCGPLDHAVPSCESGSCAPSSCDTGFGDCDDTGNNGCEATLDSLQHCTGCDVPCNFTGSTNACTTGTCVALTCNAPDYADCDGDLSDGCESLSDAASCGACGQVCGDTLPHVTGATCAARDCALTCAQGYDDCNGDWTDGCEVQLVSTTHCGACNTPCAFTNGTGDCSSGTCELADCNPGFGNCDDDASDGCETNTNTDPGNCGDCDAPMCTTANGKPYCQGGQCSAISCTPPMADCSGTGLSCPDNLSNDPSNCGSCDNVCAFNVGSPHATLTGCSNSLCTISCQSGYADCDGNYQNGCEQALNVNNHCGACNMACTVPNGTGTCASGTCQVASCNPDYGNCTAAPGCETQLNSTSHCNACNAACNLPGAIETCSGAVGSRTCQISGCDQSYLRDCPPNSSADGCETDVRANENNCGACGNDCSSHANVMGATCSSQICGYTCNTGYKACDSDPNNGCDTSIRTNTNCGDCGVACMRANAAASCSTGTCTLGACNGGHGNCDGNDLNGCEPLTSLQNCGACAAPCNLPNGTETCSTGSCQVGTCDAGWGNCDNDPSNGCERNTSVLGPCFPDTNCTKVVYLGRDYFFCSNAVNWATARQRCQTQLQGGDLVHIDDMAEHTFVHTNTGADSWIGANDSAVEGTWRWANDNVQFWMGVANGSAVGGQFARWASGEPNNYNGVQDCAQLYKNAGAGNGYWDDDDCALGRRFVCEVRGDLCPSDPLKDVPGQCGCGSADTDTDSDGTANCIDGCPNDMAKIAAGTCGCGTPDTDSDSDGTPNCNDPCPNDPLKVQPGACGCGVAETNTDGDAAPNCVDTCPYDSTVTNGTCGFDYTVSNFNKAPLNFAGAPDATLNCGTTVVNTTPPPPAGSTCGSLQLYGGHGYFHCSDARTYASAKTQCANIGGSLVSIDSMGENDFVRDMIGASPAILGANDIGAEGVWRWSAGTNDSGGAQFWMGAAAGSAVGGLFSYWNPAEPNDSSGEDCAQMYGAGATAGRWNDYLCTGTAAYVCELNSTAPTISNWCGTAPVPVVQTQSGGPDMVVIPLRTLNVTSGNTLRVVGGRPLVLAVPGNVTVAGTIDARGVGATPGGGGGVSANCVPGRGTDGVHDGDGNDGSSGGGGGGYGSAGGNGGSGDGGPGGSAAGGAAGAATLIPLRGGCSGGRGGGAGGGRFGGGGGGAVQITSGALMTIANTARISASGGGGLRGDNDEDGGGGGGSGGAVLLESSVVTTASGAWLTANGGGAGSGNASNNANGNPGADGSNNSASAAGGGGGNDGGGNGGNGATGAGNGSNGGGGSCAGLLCLGGSGGGGGGGGGGQGRVRVNASRTCTKGHSHSPVATYGGTCI